jgi:hypothetical protein
VLQCLPRLFPRDHARFEAGNNAVGHNLIEVEFRCVFPRWLFAHRRVLLVSAFLAVACDIHAEGLLAKAGGSKCKVEGYPPLLKRSASESGKGEDLHERSAEDWGHPLRARGQSLRRCVRTLVVRIARGTNCASEGLAAGCFCEVENLPRRGCGRHFSGRRSDGVASFSTRIRGEGSHCQFVFGVPGTVLGSRR